jgi:hypothetical protein
MIAILVMEMRGFSRLGSELARDMQFVGVTPERVRSAGIQIVNGVIDAAKRSAPFLSSMHLGGDTWFFTFEDVASALDFSRALLSAMLSLANDQGIFYLKPSLALTIGKPKTSDGRFLDDESIAAYKVADSGKPYHLFVLGKAIDTIKRIASADLAPYGSVETEPEVQILDWMRLNQDDESGIPQRSATVSLPTLLLDSEVIYSNSTREALTNIKRQQERSVSIAAFGGPIALDIPMYREYAQSVIKLLRTNPQVRISILSYLPLNETANCFTWLELCRRIVVERPDQFAVAAFTIPETQLRPFSYHIYDDRIIHIGLRSFSTQTGTATMSSAIMFRNAQVTQRFREEFLENWRRVGPLTDAAYANILTGLKGLTPDIKRVAYERIDGLLTS